MNLPLLNSRLATYLGARDSHLDLTTGSADQLSELVADTAEQGKTVVLGQGSQQVLDGLAATAGLLLELSHNLALVGGAQRRRLEDRHQLRVFGQKSTQLAERGASWLEGGSLDGGRVLLRRQNDAAG